MIDCFHVVRGICTAESDLRFAHLVAYSPDALLLGQSMEQSADVGTCVIKKCLGGDAVTF